MAIKINAGDTKVVHGDLFRIDPAHIDASHSNNGRYFEHDAEKVLKLALSIIDHGQEQPAKVRKVDDNKVALVSGFRRHAAVTLINTDPDLRQKAGLADGENLKLDVVYSNMNADEAFIHNLVENKDREATSAIDDAEAQRRLREKHGWDDERIGAFYGYGKAWVQRMAKLLLLSEDHKRLVHEGKLPVMEAMNLSDLPEDQRDELVKGSLISDDGEVDKGKLKDTLREARNKSGKSLGRSSSDIRKDIEAIIEDDGQDEVVRNFAKDFMRYLKGKVGAQGLLNAVERLRAGGGDKSDD